MKTRNTYALQNREELIKAVNDPKNKLSKISRDFQFKSKSQLQSHLSYLRSLGYEVFRRNTDPKGGKVIRHSSKIKTFIDLFKTGISEEEIRTKLGYTQVGFKMVYTKLLNSGKLKQVVNQTPAVKVYKKEPLSSEYRHFQFSDGFKLQIAKGYLKNVIVEKDGSIQILN